MQSGPFGFDFFFTVFPGIFSLFFIAIMIFMIVSLVKSLLRWNKNNHSPVLTVDARLVSRRADTRTTSHAAGNNNTFPSSSTTYYVTFEVESGDRMEFSVSAQEYGMLAEGDTGRLTFQGTRYRSFTRTRSV